MMRHALAVLAVSVSVTALAIALSGCGSSSTSTSTSTSASTSTAAAGGSGAAGGSAATSTTAATATTSTTAATATTSTTGTGPTITSGPGSVGIPHATLTVKPTVGGPTSVLHFSFRAPQASGRQGATDASYTLSVLGPHGSGCVAAETMALPPVTRGQMVTAALGPAGGRWCAGTYSARADEVERPICSGGQMCPQFVRLVAVVGPVPFRITP